MLKIFTVFCFTGMNNKMVNKYKSVQSTTNA